MIGPIPVLWCSVCLPITAGRLTTGHATTATGAGTRTSLARPVRSLQACAPQLLSALQLHAAELPLKPVSPPVAACLANPAVCPTVFHSVSVAESSRRQPCSHAGSNACRCREGPLEASHRRRVGPGRRQHEVRAEHYWAPGLRPQASGGCASLGVLLSHLHWTRQHSKHSGVPVNGERVSQGTADLI